MDRDYDFMTVKEAAEKLYSLTRGTSLDFTFDIPEYECEDFEPSDWYGIKYTQFFDELYGVLCIGYYGGLETEIINIKEDDEVSILFQDFCNKVCGRNVEWICVSKKYNGG